MNWESKLDNFGHEVLAMLGERPNRYENPILEALKNDPATFIYKAQQIKGFSMTAMTKVATICQMEFFDENGGPEGDNTPKALRRHWYAWFKTEFAQPFSIEMGEDPQDSRWGINWSGRLSQVYGWFVDNMDVTYKDLWVEDASRMWEKNWSTLFEGFNVILAVEKDSLFADFEVAAKSIGARAILSGKGKNSKAATEKVLREAFDWSGWSDPFTYEDPLYILHISDHDYDGEAVIGPTFGEQARRYTRHVVEARVGIKPEQLQQEGYVPHEKWYEIKVSNSSARAWANEKAMWDGDRAMGFEVEAMKTRDYYGLIVDALVQVVDWDYLVRRLRDECTANADDAARVIAFEVLEENESYQELLEEFRRLEAVKAEFQNRVHSVLAQVGEPHENDWWDLEDDPTPRKFRNYVKRDEYGEVWRPFSTRKRTAKLNEFVREDAAWTIQTLKEETLNW